MISAAFTGRPVVAAWGFCVIVERSGPQVRVSKMPALDAMVVNYEG
jgi:hypothetical protein